MKVALRMPGMGFEPSQNRCFSSENAVAETELAGGVRNFGSGQPGQ